MKCVFAIILTAAASFAANIDFSTGQAARLVIGQPYFDSESDSASNTILGAVGGLAFANNLLFVADSNVVGAAPVNNRVVIYQNVSGQLPALTAQLPYNRVCPVCVGTANEVLGQPDFVTTLPQGPSSTTRTTGLNTPEGLAVDAAGEPAGA